MPPLARVGYIVGDAEPDAVMQALAKRLSAGIVPLIVALDALPMSASGKVDRKALPWPPPRPAASEAADGALAGTEAWLAERWAEQLGPLPISAQSDFFKLGGSSLAAAKLTSALRERFPAIAVADIYTHRRLGQLAARLEQLAPAAAVATARSKPERTWTWDLLSLLGVLVVKLAEAPPWLIGVLALGRLEHLGPQVGWGWLIAGWLLFGTVPGHVALLSTAQRLLLGGLQPGRYRRHSVLTFKLWLLERLSDAWRLQGLEGTPWASRYARLCGHRVGAGTRLDTLPPAGSLVCIGAGVTVERDVDLAGWWIDGDALVVGAPRIGDGARLGTQCVLMPGAVIGAGAEIEPGTVITGTVPPGQRWAGSPGRCVGCAEDQWPSAPAPQAPPRSRQCLMYAVAMLYRNVMPLLAGLPALACALLVSRGHGATGSLVRALALGAPAVVLSYMLAYAILVAVAVRAVAPLIAPGWHPADGATSWALWLTRGLHDSANQVLFPLYMSVYTRAWLRLLGIEVGPRAEISVLDGLNRLVRVSSHSFMADHASLVTSRSRRGWLHVAGIDVERGAFVGNGAIVAGGTRLGEGSLIGVLSSAPAEVPAGSSWFGCPALELPQRCEATDRTRTLAPPRRLIIARGTVEVVRILLPASLSLILGLAMFDVLAQVGARDGLAAMALATPFAFLTAGICAAAMTILLKWLLIGRYRRSEHPLWSFFVWRDEIMNTAQEHLSSPWLIRSAMGTPLMRVYLRLMGARVGRDVWCETLAITEFDMVRFDDGSVVNRLSPIDTHLYHDRMLRIGPARLAAGATLGPHSALLPDTIVGERASVGGRSVLMRGEQLPAGTRWHGAPVVSV